VKRPGNASRINCRRSAEKVQSEIGFASVYPAATIFKIICVQVLLVMLE